MTPIDPAAAEPVGSDIRAAEPAPLPAARSHLLRLLLLIVAATVAAVAWTKHRPEPGGRVESIFLTTKDDIAGQARGAYDSVMPTTPDLYLVVHRAGGESMKLPTLSNTPIGSGLTWKLPANVERSSLERVDVFDHRAILKDKQLDRIELPTDAWSARGQTFQLTLNGPRNEPPPWTLPVAIGASVLAAILLLRFVWDQAI